MGSTVIEMLLLAGGAVLGIAGTVIGRAVLHARRRPAEGRPRTRRILFPFVGRSLSESALDAALRLARAEEATLVPAYLATVPMSLVLDAPLPRTCDIAFEIFEATEQRAAPLGIPVDSRIARGRNTRHAMRLLIAQEGFDRIVVPAATESREGFTADDVAWLLSNAPGEILVLRPALQPDRQRSARPLRAGPGAPIPRARAGVTS